MTKFEKYSVKSLQNENVLLPLSCQIVVPYDTKVYKKPIYLGVSLSASTSCGCDCLATKGVRPFFIHIIKLLTTVCQTVLKVESRHKVPRPPYRLRNGRISTNSPKASLSSCFRETLHSRSLPKNSTARRPLSSRSGATTSCPAVMPPCTTLHRNSTLCRTSIDETNTFQP